jgi:hypothetical protein
MHEHSLKTSSSVTSADAGTQTDFNCEPENTATENARSFDAGSNWISVSDLQPGRSIGSIEPRTGRKTTARWGFTKQNDRKAGIHKAGQT